MSAVEIAIVAIYAASIGAVVLGAIGCVNEWRPETSKHRAPSPWPPRFWAAVDVLLAGWRELAKASMYRGAAL